MSHATQAALNCIICGMGDYLTLPTAVSLAIFWPMSTKLH